MLYTLFSQIPAKNLAFIGLFTSFLVTCILLHAFRNILPRDGGRAFAVNGGLSQGKPRGAGLIFILVFVAAVLLFIPINRENLIYLLMLVGAMLSGYLDDSSKTPWGEYKKGFIDLVIALVCSVTYVNFNGSSIHFFTTGTVVTLNPVVYIILAMILIWVAINVTNCSDGVDGLSGSLAITTILTFYVLFNSVSDNFDYAQICLFMVACILGYLWYNASPSRMLMGDAGSRAIGLFIALIALKSQNPLCYIPASFVFIIDGGLGLIKVALLRFLKIHILRNTRTPIHDHVRKNKNWSDTQTVFRFIIIQMVISCLFIYLVI